jgi:hypothetical protein
MPLRMKAKSRRAALRKLRAGRRYKRRLGATIEIEAVVWLGG